jgi:hypothetical protein
MVGAELNYSHVEKLSLTVVHIVHQFLHYIFLRNTTFTVVVNPFQYVLTRRVISGKISRWIVILQEFELDFVSVKSKKSLVLAKLISKLTVESGNILPEESLINRIFFLITSSNPWYEDILVYLHTLKCPSSASRDEHQRICHQVRNYIILDDNLYHRGVDCIIH